MIDNELILKKLHDGEIDAEEELIKNNMGLVIGIAKRFINRGYEIEDLTQVGSVGLIKAIRKFDKSFNVKFSTYAVPLIMGEIRRFIRDDGPIKVSRTHKTNAMKAWRANEILTQKLDRAPTISELSTECKIPEDELIEAMEATTPPESLYKTGASVADDERELIDKIGAVSEENSILDKVLISQSLNILTARERKVITLRYFSLKTQSSISDIIGVSQVQVSRIEKAALEKMKSFIREK